MTQAEKLEALIRKAHEGGYSWATEPIMRHADSPEKLAAMLLSNRYYMYYLLFDHDFAKALWGERPLAENWRETNLLNGNEEYHQRYILGSCAWQYHLQQMVIAEDPIKYLGEHI